MQFLLTLHVRAIIAAAKGSGHVRQGRVKAFPIGQDEHLLTMLRNLLWAKPVRQAKAWPWSSLAWQPGGNRPELL